MIKTCSASQYGALVWEEVIPQNQASYMSSVASRTLLCMEQRWHRKDDWEKHLTTLGRTAAVHEYFVFAALSSSHGAQTWQRVPGAACCDAKLLAHRTAWVLANAKLIPAHRREPHPSWTAAVRLFLLLLHPQPLTMLWAWTQRGKYTTRLAAA